MIGGAVLTTQLLVLALLSGCTPPPAAAPTLDRAPPRVGSSTVHFATRAEAAAHLARQDAFFARLSSFDIGFRRGRPGVTLTAFRKFAAAQALDWSPGERLAWTKAFRTVGASLVGLRLPLPKRLLLIKTTGKEEFGAAYTRGAAIILGPSQAALPAARLTGLAAHELFHVASRHATPAWRDAAYGLLGFRRRAGLRFPASSEDRRLTNPDAFTLAHVVIVTAKSGEKRAVAPVLLSKRGLAKAIERGDLMAILDLRLLDAGTGELLEPKATDYLARVARNTPYVIHVEEAMADHFALLVKRRAGRLSRKLPAPEVLDRLEALLAR